MVALSGPMLEKDKLQVSVTMGTPPGLLGVAVVLGDSLSFPLHTTEHENIPGLSVHCLPVQNPGLLPASQQPASNTHQVILLFILVGPAQ